MKNVPDGAENGVIMFPGGVEVTVGFWDVKSRNE